MNRPSKGFGQMNSLPPGYGRSSCTLCHWPCASVACAGCGSSVISSGRQHTASAAVVNRQGAHSVLRRKDSPRATHGRS
eukprot:2825172-Prymnesium_polylepis.1